MRSETQPPHFGQPEDRTKLIGARLDNLDVRLRGVAIHDRARHVLARPFLAHLRAKVLGHDVALRFVELVRFVFVALLGHRACLDRRSPRCEFRLRPIVTRSLDRPGILFCLEQDLKKHANCGNILWVNLEDLVECLEGSLIAFLHLPRFCFVHPIEQDPWELFPRLGKVGRQGRPTFFLCIQIQILRKL